MNLAVKIACLLSLILLISTVSMTDDKKKDDMIYNYSANSIDGEEIKMSTYKGKVLLIVNVASQCGFTKQYEALEALYQKYKDKGFEILAFPCNQFGNQEPGTSQEIKDFCKLKYDVTFQLFEKIDVNGEKAHPLYKFLTKAAPGMIVNAIKWNFTKFLVDKDGLVVSRYAPQTTPESLEDNIVKLLNK